MRVLVCSCSRLPACRAPVPHPHLPSLPHPPALLPLPSRPLQYGAELSTVPRLLEVAASLGLTVRGVSFHVGSGAKNPAAFTAAIESARSVFDLALTLGFEMVRARCGAVLAGCTPRDWCRQQRMSSREAATCGLVGRKLRALGSSMSVKPPPSLAVRTHCFAALSLSLPCRTPLTWAAASAAATLTPRGAWTWAACPPPSTRLWTSTSLTTVGGGCAGKRVLRFPGFKGGEQCVVTLSELDALHASCGLVLTRSYPFAAAGKLRIIAEPGRYFAEAFATFACYINGWRGRNVAEAPGAPELQVGAETGAACCGATA